MTDQKTVLFLVGENIKLEKNCSAQIESVDFRRHGLLNKSDTSVDEIRQYELLIRDTSES